LLSFRKWHYILLSDRENEREGLGGIRQDSSPLSIGFVLPCLIPPYQLGSGTLDEKRRKVRRALHLASTDTDVLLKSFLGPVKDLDPKQVKEGQMPVHLMCHPGQLF